MYEFIHHTGDVRVRVASASLEDLYRDALTALRAYIEARPDGDATAVKRNIRVESADRTALLVDFLNETLTLSMIRREMYSEVHFRLLAETELDATLVGTPAAFGEEVKAVTYHEANVIRQPDGSWTTMLVFDI